MWKTIFIESFPVKQTERWYTLEKRKKPPKANIAKSHKANGAFSKYKKVKLDSQTKCFPRNAQSGSHFLTQKQTTLSIFSGSSSSFNPIVYSFSMTHKDWPTISHGFICIQSHNLVKDSQSELHIHNLVVFGSGFRVIRASGSVW